jgi:hypothetical protein
VFSSPKAIVQHPPKNSAATATVRQSTMPHPYNLRSLSDRSSNPISSTSLIYIYTDFLFYSLFGFVLNIIRPSRVEPYHKRNSSSATEW